MEDCIFCKLVNKDIPSYTIYENDDIYAFLDLSQTTKGHTLIIPKKHVPDVFMLDDSTAEKLFAHVPKIARALEAAFPEMKGLNIINNNRQLAYQSVFHAHLHLIPRYSKEDDFSIHFSDNQADHTSETMQILADTIKQEVKNES